MRLLLDTHAVLWWVVDDPHLTAMARAAIAEPANDVYVSAVVGYEIVYKQARGQLPALPGSLSQRLLRERFESLPVSMAHAISAAELPGPHRDPWDRIMMAQALAERCHVVTSDAVFSEYGISVVW